MDDSQSSEVFSENAELSCRRPSLIDETAFKELIQNTKQALSKDLAAEAHISIEQHFGTLLEDCVNCVYQLLTKISNHLDDPNLEFSDLIQCMEEIIDILQLLSAFIKNVADAVTMTCKDMKTFPVYTGQILHAIFTHCKESESTYGFHLKTLQKQLKDLFRSCHELQMAYLVIMEKHFVFNLQEIEELDILIEALEINLEIGEIVMSLDLKTLAEQWKAYTMICERYSNYMLDKDVFQNCMASLSKIVVSNIKTASEEKDQALLRAIKVAAFAIKIVSKMCHIFKRGVARKLDDIIDLIIFIHMNNSAYLKYQNKSPQFGAAAGPVACAGAAVLAELIDDKELVNVLLGYNIEKLHKDDTILGYVLVLLAVMKTLVMKDNPEISALWLDSTDNLVQTIFWILPHCHSYLNLDLEFETKNRNNLETCSLYENIIIHTAALAAMFNTEQYAVFERAMFEGILGTCLYRGLFASDIWVILAKNKKDHKLTMGQIKSLCDVYKKLESNKMFDNSPQKMHLTFTIERLYKTLSKDDKIRLFDSLQLQNDGSKNLWGVFKIRNFPTQKKSFCEDKTVNELNSLMDKLNSKNKIKELDVHCLIKEMKLASTCSFQTSIDINSIAEAWLKLCPKSNIIIQENMSLETMWVLEYVKALQGLTMSCMHQLHMNSGCVTKILHIVSTIMPSSSLEVKFVLLKLVINLALYNHQNAKIDALLSNIFKELFQENDVIFKSKLYQRLRQHSRNKTVENLVTNAVKEDLSVKSQWEEFLRKGKTDNANQSLIEQLKATLSLEFSHKCVQATIEVPICANFAKIDEHFSPNFDNESVFSIDSDFDQPICKKAKLDLSEVEEVMCRIEKDVAKLCALKSVPLSEYRSRVQLVCDQLNSLVQ